MLEMELTIKPLGDSGIQLRFAQSIDEGVNRQLHTFNEKLVQQAGLPIVDVVPGYTTLSIFYNPVRISYSELEQELSNLFHQFSFLEQSLAKECITIPVLYGGEWGPDLPEVAEYHGLTMEEVIQLHCSKPYYVYMLGFTPGFPYLGGMPARLTTPRLETPRAKVAQGSVGIAGAQTGIYPIESPGGWRIIGRTPLCLYDPLGSKPILLKPGQYIQFKPISQQEYLDQITTTKNTRI